MVMVYNKSMNMKGISIVIKRIVLSMIVLFIIALIIYTNENSKKVDIEIYFYEIAKNTRHFSREMNWQGFELSIEYKLTIHSIYLFFNFDNISELITST